MFPLSMSSDRGHNVPSLDNRYMIIDLFPKMAFSLTDIVAATYICHKINDAHCLAICKVLSLVDFTVW